MSLLDQDDVTSENTVGREKSHASTKLGNFFSTLLDPFVGSGTTALAAIQLGRSYVGIDINKEYIDLARERTAQTQIRLPSVAETKELYSTKRKRPQAKKAKR